MEYEYRESSKNNSSGNYVSPYRAKNTARNTAPAKKAADCTTGVIITQVVVLTLISIVVFGMYKTQSGTFSQLKAIYNSYMEKDMSVKEIGDAVKSVFGSITKPRNAFSENETTDVETTKSLPGEAATVVDPTAAGGEDLLVATDNKTFAPFYLSTPMVTPLKNYRISSYFGYRVNPVTNEYGFHTGLDMAADEGTPIFAAFDGVVTKVSASKGRGNYLFIESENSIKTVYCHCSEIIAQEGTKIKAGEVIAKVGSTGMSTGPHLHFEIIVNGVYCNPIWVVEKP